MPRLWSSISCRSIWNNGAWAILGVLLFIAAGTSWAYGDNHQHYNGFLVTLGWVFLIAGIYFVTDKPSSQAIAGGFAAHRGKILPCLLFALGLYVYIGDILIYIAPSWTYGYAWKFGVANSKVAIGMRPHNCEWQTAPLGVKNCHYEAQVSSVRTATATDGTTPLVSCDEGKTWQANVAHEEPSVFVSWTKVDE